MCFAGRFTGDFDLRRYDELEKVRGVYRILNVIFQYAADITDGKHRYVTYAHEQVLACKGRIDWLINNAGLEPACPRFRDTTMQTERTIMEVDYFFTGISLPRQSAF